MPILWFLGLFLSSYTYLRFLYLSSAPRPFLLLLYLSSCSLALALLPFSFLPAPDDTSQTSQRGCTMCLLAEHGCEAARLTCMDARWSEKNTSYSLIGGNYVLSYSLILLFFYSYFLILLFSYLTYAILSSFPLYPIFFIQ